MHDDLRLSMQVFDLAAERGVTLRVLDIGGGFPGFDGSEPIYHGEAPGEGEEELPLSCEAIATDLVPLINQLFPPESGVQVRGCLATSHLEITRGAGASVSPHDRAALFSVIA